MEIRSHIPRFVGPGCLVEFMQGDKPVLAWVEEEQAGKYRLLTLAKREMKMSAARLLPWIGPCYDAAATRTDIMNALRRHNDERESLDAAVDAMELWELAQSEVDQASAAFFAELLWESPDADKLAAMGRALLRCKTHFKFNAPHFEIYPREKVEARLVEREAAKQRERVERGGQIILGALWEDWKQGKPAPGAFPDRLPEWEELAAKAKAMGVERDVAESLRDMLLQRIADPADKETQPLWNKIRQAPGDDTRQPLILARQWGLIPPHYNYLLDQARYEPGDAWTARHAEEIGRIEREFVTERDDPATTVDPRVFLAVDSSATRDVDDAFHIERDGYGYRLVQALACPAAHWRFGGPLDKDTANRATSLYLPEGDHHMLPERLAADMYSLLDDGPRPALLLDMRMDNEAALLTMNLSYAWVNSRNLTYEKAEALIVSDTPQAAKAPGYEEFAGQLRLAVELARKLRAARLASGAVIIEREDPEISVRSNNGDVVVDMEFKDVQSHSQFMISELMILANSAVAAWARERDVALAHRSQDIALPREFSGVWSEPEDVSRVVKSLGGSSLEATPRPHASLGAPAYSPISSPLRRYTDLLNMGQVLSHIRQGSARLAREEMESALMALKARLEAVGPVQRFRPRYWKLVFFKQRGSRTLWPVVVVDESQRLVTVSQPLAQIFLRAPRSMFGDKITPGQVFEVRLGKIDPLNNEIQILEAREQE